MHVSTTTDRGYLPHAAAMLHSAISSTDTTIVVHLLHDRTVDAAGLDPVRRLVDRGGGELRPHLVDDRQLARISDRRFPRIAWYRTLLPTLAGHLDRVVHLDADLLVCSSLEPLWRTDLDGAPVAAVENPLYPWMRPAWQRLSLPAGTPYLNSGVMVLDLVEMRRRGLAGELHAYGAAHPENPWPEQDALSAVLAGNWRRLDPHWNVQTSFFDLRVDQLPWTAAVTAKARTRPSIVHSTGPLKPWHGWGPAWVVDAYEHHRRAAGMPLGRIHRPVAARLAPRLPWALRRRLLRRVVQRHVASES